MKFVREKEKKKEGFLARLLHAINNEGIDERTEEEIKAFCEELSFSKESSPITASLKEEAEKYGISQWTPEDWNKLKNKKSFFDTVIIDEPGKRLTVADLLSSVKNMDYDHVDEKLTSRFDIDLRRHDITLGVWKKNDKYFILHCYQDVHYDIFSCKPVFIKD